ELWSSSCPSRFTRVDFEDAENEHPSPLGSRQCSLSFEPRGRAMWVQLLNQVKNKSESIKDTDLNESLLETFDLRKTYRFGKIDVEALRGINVKIHKGQLVAIMGPSGCGKSTLMHILGGLSKPTSGRVLIAGIDLVAINDRQRTEIRRKNIGFVFQKFNLPPTLTARANIDVARKIGGHRYSG